MTELKVKTKGDGRPDGKPRVFFTCHPADFERSFERLCADIFASSDCAVYYTEDMTVRLPEETRETDLERMNLFVIPVSLKLLLEPNRAMDEDFPFAREKGIPVLPIMLEPGLDLAYKRKDKFFDLQYVDPYLQDTTTIPYNEKLKKYLGHVLFESKIVERIQKAFDAYIFLSYRKKDRKKANELMRLIHADPECRDIAIWYDEYLTPGESFSDAIELAMRKSKLFTLLVSPSILEPNDIGEPNYVQSKEFPRAKETEMEMLSAELLDEGSRPTNREALFRDFLGLPRPLNLRIDSEREHFFAKLKDLAKKECRANPSHNYLIGLAYLDGIDVEVDRTRGVDLIRSAANAGLVEAMEKIANMYHEGHGVALDWTEELIWRKRIVDYYTQRFGPEEIATLYALSDLASVCGDVGDWKQEVTVAKRLQEICKKSSRESHPVYIKALNCLSIAYENLGYYYYAKNSAEEAYSLACQLFGNSHPVSLAAQNNLAHSYASGPFGDYKKAVEIGQDNYESRCKILGKVHPCTLISLDNLASYYRGLKKYETALQLFQEVYSKRKEIFGEDHPSTLIALTGMASTQQAMGNQIEFKKIISYVYEAQKYRLGEAHPNTLSTLSRLIAVYKGTKSVEERLYFTTLERLKQQWVGCSTMFSLDVLSHIAHIYERIQNYDIEIELRSIIYERSCELLGVNHHDSIEALTLLISSKTRKTNHGADPIPELEELLPLQQTLCERKTKILGAEHPDSISSVRHLAFIYEKLERFSDALKILEGLTDIVSVEKTPSEAYKLYCEIAIIYRKMRQNEKSINILSAIIPKQRAVGVDSFDLELTMTNLMYAFEESGNYEKAIDIGLELLDYQSQVLESAHPRLIITLKSLALYYEKVGDVANTIKTYERIYDLQCQRYGITSARTNETMSILNSYKKINHGFN